MKTESNENDKEPLVKYEPDALQGPPIKTEWLEVTLASGAQVRVGLQRSHRHGIALVHDLRHTQPDTGKMTQLVFCLSLPAARALVAIYAAHGVLEGDDIRKPRKESGKART